MTKHYSRRPAPVIVPCEVADDPELTLADLGVYVVACRRLAHRESVEEGELINMIHAAYPAEMLYGIEESLERLRRCGYLNSQASDPAVPPKPRPPWCGECDHPKGRWVPSVVDPQRVAPCPRCNPRALRNAPSEEKA